MYDIFSTRDIGQLLVRGLADSVACEESSDWSPVLNPSIISDDLSKSDVMLGSRPVTENEVPTEGL